MDMESRFSLPRTAEFNRVRISAQLIDGTTGNHLWAERYDREIEDIFTVQDEITQTVVGAILPELSQAEQERARRKPPENLDAWECYQRGIWHIYRRTRDDLAEAQELFKRATDFDPNMSAAYAGLVDPYFFQIVDGHAKDKDHAIQEAISAGRNVLMHIRQPASPPLYVTCLTGIEFLIEFDRCNA